MRLRSATLFVLDEDFVAYRRGCKISNTKTGFEAKFRDSDLAVDFVLLQNLYQPSDRGSVAILPANEFFDERCFGDEHTAAGSFVAKYFPTQAKELRNLVHRELKENLHQSISFGPDITKQSYGVGTCVYLGQPLAQAVRIIFAAVASDRLPYGLRTDLSIIFKAVEEIKCNSQARD